MLWGPFDIKEIERVNQKSSRGSFYVLLGLSSFALVFFYPTVYSIAIVLVGVAIACRFPQWIARLHTGWHRLGLVLGYLISPIFLTLFYFLLLSPFVVLLKVFGHKPYKTGWVGKKKQCIFGRSF